MIFPALLGFLFVAIACTWMQMALITRYAPANLRLALSVLTVPIHALVAVLMVAIVLLAR